MTIAQLENLIRYVTNAQGQATDVIVPLETWQELINYLGTNNISGLAEIDEKEPKAQILDDLQESIKLGQLGQTFSISQLWADSIT
jgi:hypothetical protein